MLIFYDAISRRASAGIFLFRKKERGKRMSKVFLCAMLLAMSVIFSGGAEAAAREKALVVVSFGTTFKETRELDVEGVEKALAAAFPDREFRRAFTSKIVMKRLWDNDGIKVDDLEAVLAKLLKEGYKDILIQPTHLTPGEEIANKVLPAVAKFQGKFARMAVGKPLLTDGRDFPLAARALEASLPALDKNEVVVFMGHGSPNRPNPAYKSLQDSFDKLGVPAVIGVVEETDHPNYEDMLAVLQGRKVQSVLLLPLMLVAGDHANNDMAGEEEDSWANLLKKEGYNVRHELKGIGRLAAIQDIYVLHALEALNS